MEKYKIIERFKNCSLVSHSTIDCCTIFPSSIVRRDQTSQGRIKNGLLNKYIISNIHLFTNSKRKLQCKCATACNPKRIKWSNDLSFLFLFFSLDFYLDFPVSNLQLLETFFSCTRVVFSLEIKFNTRRKMSFESTLYVSSRRLSVCLW